MIRKMKNNEKIINLTKEIKKDFIHVSMYQEQLLKLSNIKKRAKIL